MNTRKALHESKDRPELVELIASTAQAYEAMTPEQQRWMRAEQRKSWVIGEMMLDHPGLTREEAERVYASVD
jgi:hypothetical protein